MPFTAKWWQNHMGGRIPHRRFGQDDRTDEKGTEGRAVANVIKKIEKVGILYYVL